MTEFILLTPFLMLLIAAVYDLCTREIPDAFAIGVLLIAIAAAALGAANVKWWMVGAGGALGLAIGALLFRFAKFGGGDAKLIAAVGALLGPVGLLLALFWMAIAGGVLALIAAARGRRDYAYGPAIAAGYFGYLLWPIGILGRFLS
jgi:prepilin peptidase CpaA